MNGREVQNETSPPTISASGRGRCRPAGGLAHCAGAGLSDAAGALHRWICTWWWDGHLCAPGRPIVARATRSAFCHRESGGSLQQYRDGGVIRAPADGYTLLGTDAAAAINAALFDNLNFNFIRDMALVCVSRGPLVVAVHRSLPVKTIPEFITYAKANAGKIALGSSGTGGINHMAGELFRTMTGMNMTHMPYRGAAPAMTDLLGGQVQVMFIGLPPSIEHIRSGRLRALAVTTDMRFEELPDLPPAGDFVPGYEASQWWAIGLRKSTPGAIVERLNKEINAILAEPQVQARLSDLGSAMFAGSSADFETFIVNETEKWSKVIRAANIKPE